MRTIVYIHTMKCYSIIQRMFIQQLLHFNMQKKILITLSKRNHTQKVYTVHKVYNDSNYMKSKTCATNLK